MGSGNGRYKVYSTVEAQPPLEQFDVIHNTESIDTNDSYMARVFGIHRPDGASKSIALIDRVCSNYPSSFAVQGNILTTILFRAIVRIDMDSGSIVQHIACENTGGLFEIHAIDSGYLVWGEEEIVCYDPEFREIWNFSSRDILVSTHCNTSFWIQEREIHCRDFLGWHYVLDLEGKLIREFWEFPDCERR